MTMMDEWVAAMECGLAGNGDGVGVLLMVDGLARWTNTGAILFPARFAFKIVKDGTTVGLAIQG